LGILKKVLLVFLVFLSIVGILFFRYYAFYHSENLEISAKISSIPSDGEISFFSVGDELGLYPSSWEIGFNIAVSNHNPSDIRLEEASYVISLSNSVVKEGAFQGVLLEKHINTDLPVVNLILPMEQLSSENPELLSKALDQNGELTFKVEVVLKTPALLFGLIRIGTAETSDDALLSVHVVDPFSVSTFRWDSENTRYVDECYPGEELVGRFRISHYGNLEGELTARVSELTAGGEENFLESKEVSGEPTGGYNEFDVNWKVPDSPPLHCIGFSVRLLFGGVEVWSTGIEVPSVKLVRRYTLAEALDEDVVDARLSGRGYCAGDAIKLEVKTELKVSVDLEIESGTVLINKGAGQNMILGETSTVRIKPQLEVDVSLEAYCLDMYKDNPSSSEVFKVAYDAEGYGEDALKLMESLENVPWEHKSISGVQIALWVIIEDPPMSEVENIFTVTESYLEDARWLLENIGVDPDQKKLFTEI
jgi:hypothetical protein